MSTIHRKGIIRGGQVLVEEPIDLPDGSEVTSLGDPHGRFLGGEDDGLPPTLDEIVDAEQAMWRYSVSVHSSRRKNKRTPNTLLTPNTLP